MSNRNMRGKSPAPKRVKFPMPTNVPLHWSTDWRFQMYADHVRFAFGHSGVMHDFVALPLAEAINMHQQLGAQIERQLAEQASGDGLGAIVKRLDS